MTTEISEWDSDLNLHVRVRRRKSQITGQSSSRGSTLAEASSPSLAPQQLPTEISPTDPPLHQEQYARELAEPSIQIKTNNNDRQSTQNDDHVHVLNASGVYAGLKRPSQRTSTSNHHVNKSDEGARDPKNKKKTNVLHFFQKLPRKILGKSGSQDALPTHFEEDEVNESISQAKDERNASFTTNATPFATHGAVTPQGASITGHTLSQREAHLFSELLMQDDPRAQVDIVRQLQRLCTPKISAETGTRNRNGTDDYNDYDKDSNYDYDYDYGKDKDKDMDEDNDEDKDNSYSNSEHPPDLESAHEDHNDTSYHVQEVRPHIETQYGGDPADLKRKTDRADARARAASPRTSFLSTLFNSGTKDVGISNPDMSDVVKGLEARDEDENEDFGGDVSSVVSSPSRAGSMVFASAQDEDDDHSASSAVSISQMLQQGQSAGKYAQTLRSILRTMNKEDSSVQLESLEQVLKLGHAIALQEKAGEAEALPTPPSSLPQGTHAGGGAESSQMPLSSGGRPPIPPSAKRRSSPHQSSYAPTPTGPVSTPGSTVTHLNRKGHAGIVAPGQIRRGIGSAPRQREGTELDSSHRNSPRLGGSISRPGLQKPTPKRWKPTQNWDNDTRVVSPTMGSVRAATLSTASPRSDYQLTSSLTTPTSRPTSNSKKMIASRTTPGKVPGTANPKSTKGPANKRVFGHRL